MIIREGSRRQQHIHPTSRSRLLSPVVCNLSPVWHARRALLRVSYASAVWCPASYRGSRWRSEYASRNVVMGSKHRARQAHAHQATTSTSRRQDKPSRQAEQPGAGREQSTVAPPEASYGRSARSCHALISSSREPAQANMSHKYRRHVASIVVHLVAADDERAHGTAVSVHWTAMQYTSLLGPRSACCAGRGTCGAPVPCH